MPAAAAAKPDVRMPRLPNRSGVPPCRAPEAHATVLCKRHFAIPAASARGPRQHAIARARRDRPSRARRARGRHGRGRDDNAEVQAEKAPPRARRERWQPGRETRSGTKTRSGPIVRASTFANSTWSANHTVRLRMTPTTAAVTAASAAFSRGSLFSRSTYGAPANPQEAGRERRPQRHHRHRRRPAPRAARARAVSRECADELRDEDERPGVVSARPRRPASRGRQCP